MSPHGHLIGFGRGRLAGYVDVRAYAELNDFLPARQRQATVRSRYRPHQTVKDVIESIGIPHTEIDLILVNGTGVGFAHRPCSGSRLAVYPRFTSVDVTVLGRLTPAPPNPLRFVVDANVARLAPLLRLVGFDARYERDAHDEDIALVAGEEDRVVLTHDRRLLTRRRVRHGVYVRAEQPLDQLVEVLRRFDLADRLEPFTRCLPCGGVLLSATKNDVLDRLEPLTRQHYDEFVRCAACGQVYWRGSHHRRLREIIDAAATAASSRRDES